MDGASWLCPKSTRSLTERYLSVGGGTDRDGNLITAPVELDIAIAIDGLAKRYGCPPSRILSEPVGILPIVELAAMAENDRNKKEAAKVKEASRSR